MTPTASSTPIDTGFRPVRAAPDQRRRVRPLLLAVRRRELRLDAPVATSLPELGGAPAGRATLVELATHTAGLPESPSAITLGGALRNLANDNPYGRAKRVAVMPSGRSSRSSASVGQSATFAARATAALVVAVAVWTM